ncbi:deleted in azoospermia-like [Leopardus geoffroyi]|uniref:deleted in azoospermia-like n=1 Tax=Leopardus geoffroyi TaxID=46844 RepID=UPI001E25E56C|nr:deleted in azoospermia-like [Leopardus geoffroyi]
MTCGSRGKGVCQPISLKSAPPWLRSADPRTPPPYPRWGSRYPPKRPPQGAGGCHPLAEAATTSFSTRRRSHLWEPRRPRLSSPAPLSIATWLLGLLDLAARFRFPSSPLLSLCPSRSRAAARAERTAALRVVPEAQPPLLLEPIQREQLAAAIMSTANPETPNSTISREASTQSSSATTSQGYVLPEGKIMPNTVFVGGIDVRMDETEIRSFFARYGSVKEVKIITDRTGVSKGYGFVSFYNDVDVQKIVESQINFHGKKLKLGPAIRKQNFCAYHVQPRPLVFNPPPPPQFQSVWSNPNTETYMQPPTMMNPITQYVQAYPPYPSSPVQVITGYQLPVYNYQMPPQWPAGEQRSYVIPPTYTAVNYHCNEVDPGAEVLQSECSVHEATPSSGNGPQKKSVDRSIQTVVSCLFNPENRLRNSLVTQDDYFKDKRVHHFRRSRAVLKSV